VIEISLVTSPRERGATHVDSLQKYSGITKSKCGAG